MDSQDKPSPRLDLPTQPTDQRLAALSQQPWARKNAVFGSILRSSQGEGSDGTHPQGNGKANDTEPMDERWFQMQLLDNVHESLIATDLDGNVLYWGRAAQKLYGYTVDEVLGRHVSFIVEPGEEHAEQERMKEVLQNGYWKGEYEQRRKDGSKFWSATTISLVKDVAGQPVGLIGIDIDITDRKREREELSQLKLAIENAMQGISRLDLEGRFTMVKPQYARMLGYQPEELIGQSWEVTVPPEDIPLATEGYRQMLRDGKASLEVRAQRKDGTVFYKQLLLVKAFDATGQRDGHYCFMSDVTARREAQDRLHDREAELAHVSRLSTMGELVAGIAHEINQPLYAIANYATVARRMLAESGAHAELEELNRQIAEQAVRAGDIIRRLRQFVSKSDGTWDQVDVEEVVRDSVTMLEPMIRRVGAMVDIDLAPGPLVVRADRVQLEQVLVNLVRNALEAVEGSDRREISIVSHLSDQQDHVQVSVSDTGSGISVDDEGKLFDAFFTTKDTGLGMGLAITKTIVEAHRGQIWASPHSSRGATFAFRIPVNPKSAC